MPTLHWIGKEKVINHHHDVPFRVLRQDAQVVAPADAPENTTDNLVIHGDNLEALKSLLPMYEGQVACAYCDPPYNTGAETWVYNDNVSDPKLQQWLGQVVGKEGEDLSRHDKWLCMIYPRLKLLHRLLSPEGVIFVSIDDNEVQHLRPVLDEIFGPANRIEQFIWKKSYGGGAKERYAVTVHEYILMYAKNKDKVHSLSLPPDPGAEARYYKLQDEKVETRGPFRVKPLEATKSMDKRENLVYPIKAPDGTEVLPKRQWWWARERVEAALANNDLYFSKDKAGEWSVQYKQYLRDDSGEERRSKPFSILDGPYTQIGSATLRAIFADRGQEVFQFPKPVELIEHLLAMLPLPKDAIILDSFAGSGTTGHAVLRTNHQKDTNYRFVLVETLPYAKDVTAERVKRVIHGYGEGDAATPGVGGGFTFCTVGDVIFTSEGELNDAVGVDAIRSYVTYTERIPVEFRTEMSNPYSPHLLGLSADLAWLFNYEPTEATCLNLEYLSTLNFGDKKPANAIIYADRCFLSKEFLQEHGIIFKKIPRDVTRF